MATLVLFNGMMSHSGWFRELATILSMQRINVVGADRRGSGLNDKESVESLTPRLLVSDARRIVNEQPPDVPVYLVGWCWGAALAIATALELGTAIDGIILLAPGLFPSQEIKAATREQIRFCNASRLISPLREDMFTDNPELIEQIRTDRLALRTFTREFMALAQQMLLIAAVRLSELTNPLLLLLAESDRTVDNKLTLERFRTLKTKVISAMLPYNHGLHLEAPDEVARNVTRWLCDQGLLIGPRPAL